MRIDEHYGVREVLALFFARTMAANGDVLKLKQTAVDLSWSLSGFLKIRLP